MRSATGMLLFCITIFCHLSAVAAEMPADGETVTLMEGDMLTYKLAPAERALVGNSQILAVREEEDLIDVTGRSSGCSSLKIGRRQFTVCVVSRDLEALRTLLVPMGNLRVTSVSGRLLVQGSVFSRSDLPRVQELCAQFKAICQPKADTASWTVEPMIRVTFHVAAVTREACRDLGLGWDQGPLSTILSSVRLASGAIGLRGLLSTTPETTTPASQTFIPGSGGELFLLVDHRDSFQLLETHDLLTLNGHTVEYASGGKRFLNGASQPLEYGVKLSATPQMDRNGLILMPIDYRVSMLRGGTSTSAIALAEQSQKTEVMLRVGQTQVLSGSEESLNERGQQGIPLLSMIPFFGHSYRHAQAQRLLIFITPTAEDPASQAGEDPRVRRMVNDITGKPKPASFKKLDAQMQEHGGRVPGVGGKGAVGEPAVGGPAAHPPR